MISWSGFIESPSALQKSIKNSILQQITFRIWLLHQVDSMIKASEWFWVNFDIKSWKYSFLLAKIDRQFNKRQRYDVN